MRRMTLMAAAMLTLTGARAGAQRIPVSSVITTDSALRHEVVMRDGSRLIGRIVAVSADSIRMQLTANVVSMPRAEVKEVRQFSASKLRHGEYWPENPNASRLLFSDTAYPITRGDRTYWTAWFLLHGFAVGVTDRFSIGGGMSLVPGIGLEENFLFITPKLTLTNGDGPQAAIGAFAGVLPGFGAHEDHQSLGFLYGVGSLGSRERNLTAGLGWGYAGREFADRPIVMLSGVFRAHRRAALISENWLVPIDNGYDGFVSAGIRFLADKVSFDVAYVNRVDDPIFPGAPWVGFTIKF